MTGIFSSSSSLSSKPSTKPWGLQWRSSTLFILITVGMGLFTDMFLYGLVVPVLPFLLQDRLDTPKDQIQKYVSLLLAAYAGASVAFSLPAGIVSDKMQSRQIPFLCGLAALMASTVMLALGQSIPVLLIARVLQGTSGAVVWSVGFAMAMDTVGPENLGKVIGSIFSVISVGDLASPISGGVLYQKAGYGGVFGVSAALLGIDFILRVLVIEKKTAAKYTLESSSAIDDATSNINGPIDGDSAERQPSTDNGDSQFNSANGAHEQTPLLSNQSSNQDKSLFDLHIPPNQPKLIQQIPILYCLTRPRLPVSLLLAFVQATLMGVFDATIPTHADVLFGFDSLHAGLLFLAMGLPYLLLGSAAGWAVDRYGPKPIAVLGFAYLVPVLILLRLPHEGGMHQILLYSGILALNGVGLAVVGSPSLVEGSAVVQAYHKANPGFFGENGPYAQLYGMNSLMFSTGLTVGPLLAGALRDGIGYGNMNLVFAIISGVTSVLSFLFIGETPKVRLWWKGDGHN